LLLCHSSTIATLREWACACSVSEGEEEQYLLSIAGNFIAQNLLSSSPNNGVLLLHQPPSFLADIIDQRSSETKIRTQYTTSRLPLPDNSKWIYINPLGPRRELKKCIPVDVERFVDWSDQSDESASLHIGASLPRSCGLKAITEFFVDEPKMDLNISPSMLRQCLVNVISHSLPTHSSTMSGGPYKIGADNLPKATVRNPFTIIDWTVSRTYQVTIKPLNPSEFLSPNKTYMLVGLTGDIGQSLGRWMVLNGARNLILLLLHRSELSDLWILRGLTT